MAAVLHPVTIGLIITLSIFIVSFVLMFYFFIRQHRRYSQRIRDLEAYCESHTQTPMQTQTPVYTQAPVQAYPHIPIYHHPHPGIPVGVGVAVRDVEAIQQHGNDFAPPRYSQSPPSTALPMGPLPPIPPLSPISPVVQLPPNFSVLPMGPLPLVSPVAPVIPRSTPTSVEYSTNANSPDTTATTQPAQVSAPISPLSSPYTSTPTSHPASASTSVAPPLPPAASTLAPPSTSSSQRHPTPTSTPTSTPPPLARMPTIPEVIVTSDTTIDGLHLPAPIPSRPLPALREEVEEGHGQPATPPTEEEEAESNARWRALKRTAMREEARELYDGYGGEERTVVCGPGP